MAIVKNKQTRKNAEKIKEEILNNLEEKPLSIEQLRKKIGSNWSTINNYVSDLIKEHKIKEFISRENIKIYQRIYNDTYFNIPLKNEQREMFRRIYYDILKEYRKRGKTPRKTQLAKSAVYITNKINEQEGNPEKKLPMMWYLYGKVTLMVADPKQDYSTTYKIRIKGFKKLIKESVDKFIDMGTLKIQKTQYDTFDNKLYIFKNKIIENLSNPKKNQKEIASLLVNFLINIDTNQDIDVFNYSEEFSSLFGQFAVLNKLDDPEIQREILLTFDSLWNFVAINQTLRDLIKEGYSKRDLEDFYLGSHIETRKTTADEKLTNLKSLYLNTLPKELPEIPISEGASEILDIFTN